MSSDHLQGSLLILFNLFLNDPDLELSSRMAKTNNTTVFWTVKTHSDCEELPKDLPMWSQLPQMGFSVNNACKRMFIGVKMRVPNQ